MSTRLVLNIQFENDSDKYEGEIVSFLKLVSKLIRSMTANGERQIYLDGRDGINMSKNKFTKWFDAMCEYRLERDGVMAYEIFETNNELLGYNLKIPLYVNIIMTEQIECVWEWCVDRLDMERMCHHAIMLDNLSYLRMAVGNGGNYLHSMRDAKNRPMCLKYLQEEDEIIVKELECAKKEKLKKQACYAYIVVKTIVEEEKENKHNIQIMV